MKSEGSGQAPVDPKTVLADTLYSRILTLQLAPGAPVVERLLCDESGLSRSTVRSTLQQLASEGLLELRSNQAPVVAALNPTTLAHFQQSAPLVYIAAAQLAAVNARPADLDELRALPPRLEEAVHARDIEAWLRLDHTLHQKIGQLADNAYLTPGLRRLHMDHGRLCKAFYAHQPWARLQHDLATDVHVYRQIIAALARHAPRETAQLARRCIETLCQRLNGCPKPVNKELPLSLNAFKHLNAAISRPPPGVRHYP